MSSSSLHAYNYDLEPSLSSSSYPNSTIEIAGEMFPGFIELESESDCSEPVVFGAICKSAPPSVLDHLLDQIKTFWKRLLEQLRTLTQNHRFSAKQASGYTISIPRKSFFKVCSQKVYKRRIRYESIQLCRPCEPLSDTIEYDSVKDMAIDSEQCNEKHMYAGRKDAEHSTDTLIESSVMTINSIPKGSGLSDLQCAVPPINTFKCGPDAMALCS